MKKFTSLAILTMLIVPVFAFADNDSSDDDYRPKPARTCPNGRTLVSNCTELPTGEAAADNRNYSQSVSNSGRKPMTRLEMYRLKKQGMAPAMGDYQKAGLPYNQLPPRKDDDIKKMAPVMKKLPALSLSSSQVSCLTSAMKTRHSAVSNAGVAAQSARSSAHLDWIDDVADAYELSGDSQKEALKKASEAQKSANEATRNEHKSSVKSARDAFKASVRTCGISNWPSDEMEMGDEVDNMDYDDMDDDDKDDDDDDDMDDDN